MKIDELWAEIEGDHKWRSDEIRFFQNQLSLLSSQLEQDQFRRAIILILYAHFEGFCKFAFTLYVNSINQESIKCSEANYALAAASLSDLFKALRDPEKKCEEFKNELPDDKKLHRFALDREFIERSVEFEKRIVKIPDDFVDTESNLKPVVLRKNLFKLGFTHNQFENIEGEIHELLNYRNKIAHGELKDGIPSDKYEKLKEATFKIMDEIKSNIMTALTNKLFLKISA